MGPSVEHWDGIYRELSSDELGWYEPRASTLPLLVEHSSSESSILDVGGGDSRLVDDLIELGYRDLSVLDLSETALERSRHRLGARAELVTWIVGDVTTFRSTRTWDVWHDRALFHFLVDEASRSAYKEAAFRALAPRGRLIVAAFAADGPDRCAGLPVARYDLETLSDRFAPELRVLASDRVVGADPAGDQRPYVIAVFERDPIMG